jgi:hypothetical protein
MATVNACLAAFALFERSNIQRTQSWPRTDEALHAMAKTWSALLFDVTDEELQNLTIQYARGKNTFMPTPGVLLELRDGDGGGWALAWGEVQKRLRSRKPFPAELLEDPVRGPALQAGIDALGGMSRLGQSSLEHEPASRACFRDAYRAAVSAARRQVARDAAAHLLGSGPGLRLLAPPPVREELAADGPVPRDINQERFEAELAERRDRGPE